MKQLNWSVAKLLIGLAVFFNIERVDFSLNNTSNTIDIHSFVYVLSLAAVLSIIFIPFLSRLPFSSLALLWFFVFLGFKILLSYERPLLGGVFTYLSLTEVAFLILLVYQAREVVEVRDELSRMAEYVTLANAGMHLPQLDEAGSKIRREMTRSRYYHRALSVIVVKPDQRTLNLSEPQLMKEIQKSVAGRRMAAKLSELLGEQLRVVDTVLEDRENGAFVILCPELDAKGTILLTEHIRHAVTDNLALNVQCGMASFPDEAVTFESLVSEAYRKLKSAAADSSAGAIDNSAVPIPSEMLQAMGD